MRLAPIERPSSWLGRLMTFAMRRQLGRSITPALVFYNRVPRMWNVSFALLRLQLTGLSIPQDLALLVQTRVGMLNGCEFCQDIARARALQVKLGMERFNALAEHATHPAFSERERAALAYADEVTIARKVGDATFERLRAHYGEREIAELVIVAAMETFYNVMNISLDIPDDGLEARELARTAARA